MTEIDNAVWQAVQSYFEHERSVAIHYQAPGYTSSAIRVIDPYHIVGFREQAAKRMESAATRYRD